MLGCQVLVQKLASPSISASGGCAEYVLLTSKHFGTFSFLYVFGDDLLRNVECMMPGHTLLLLLLVHDLQRMLSLNVSFTC